jgi:hydrogenase maturation protease
MNQFPDGARKEHSGTVKVIGIGQRLRGDDAAGLAAVCYWQLEYQARVERPNVQVELAELPGIGLINLLEGAKTVILVDAVHSHARAGTIHRLSEDKLETFSEGAESAHGWGVAETLLLGQKLMPASMPEELYLIGIEAGDISLGEGLSREVECALPETARLIETLVTRGESIPQDSCVSSRISPK